MKNLLLLMFIVILSLNLFAQNGDDPRCCSRPCYDNSSCVNPGPWVFVEDEVVVPEFPGCILTVHYCWRECRDNYPHTVQMKVCEIHFLYPCQQCNVVQTFLRPNGTLSARRARKLESYIIKQITLEKFIIWYNGAPQQFKDMVDCNTGNYHAKYQFWRGSCSAWC